MKAGLSTSLVLHAVLLGFGLVTLSSPRPLDLSNSESFPVDIVPIEEVSQSVRGEREAPVSERPAPTPTTRPEPVEDAQHVGDNVADLSTPPTPDPRPRPVETAEAPPPASEPTPPTPEPVPAPQEATPAPQPPREAIPDPAPEPQPVEAPNPDSVSLPTNAPAPQARPQPQTASTPQRREPERQQEQTRQQQTSSESNTRNIEDQVAALLNRDRASGGGAQRSQQEASLGGRQTTGAKLSQSEEDAIRRQLQSCWNVPAGAVGGSELKAVVSFKLDPSGSLQGQPTLEKSSGDRAFDDTTLRAVRVCNQRGFQLPADKYDAWAEVKVTFDPRDMF